MILAKYPKLPPMSKYSDETIREIWRERVAPLKITTLAQAKAAIAAKYGPVEMAISDQADQKKIWDLVVEFMKL